MSIWVDSLVILLVLTDFILLATYHLYTKIRVIAFQGVLLGILPLIIEPHLSTFSVILSVIMIAVKGVVFPQLLRQAIRQTNTKREIEPYVGFVASLFIGLVMLGLTLWIGSNLSIPEKAVSSLGIPVAMFTLLCGLFLIVSRKNALTQVLGYLTMENGIYAFGVLFILEEPILVELSALLDLLVGVFLMGVIAFHISRSFDHIDTGRLSSLHDQVQSHKVVYGHKL